MDIEIWIDLTCPFCYMASHNFETALKRFPHTKKLNVIWRSFELDPDAPFHYEGNQYSLLAAKYNKTEQEIMKMTLPVVKEGASIGLTFNFDTAKPVNTFDAHRLLHLAAEFGKQKIVRNKLYRACFTEGMNISGHHILMNIGIEGGLQKADISKMLNSEAYSNFVRCDEQKARDSYITSVPNLLIDKRYLIKGNKSPEQYVKELLKLWGEGNNKLKNNGCDSGSCEI